MVCNFRPTYFVEEVQHYTHWRNEISTHPDFLTKQFDDDENVSNKEKTGKSP